MRCAYYTLRRLPVIEERLGVKREDSARLFNELQVMEAAAKEVLNKAKDE